MSHVPNIQYREALGLGRIGTLGLGDFASPDNDLWPLRTPGTLDLCSAADIDEGESCLAELTPDDAQAALFDELSCGPEYLADQAYVLPPAAGTPARLTQKDFELAAASLKCEVAAVKAVAEVEARGAGFFADGRPKILFEAHHFSRLTARAYDRLYPAISSPRWKPELYAGGVKEYDRLEEAMELDAHAAIQSASWGAFQIMGFNYDAAGFTCPEDFVAAMFRGEGEHLKAFVSFVQKRKLAKLIQTKNWAAFAEEYNGPGYRENEYDTKLAKAYAKHAVSKPPLGGAGKR